MSAKKSFCRLLKPNEIQQNEALIAAMSEILWNIGEKSQVTVVLPGDNPHVVHSHSYFQDSVTEKVRPEFRISLNKSYKIEISLIVSCICSNSLNWRTCKFS